MAVIPVEKQVGDHFYLYRPLTATPALRLFSRLTKTIGPAFAALAASSAHPTTALSAAATALSSTLGEKDLEEVLKTFAAQTEEGGSALLPRFELFFTDMKTVFGFLMFALEAQFGGFFGA